MKLPEKLGEHAFDASGAVLHADLSKAGGEVLSAGKTVIGSVMKWTTGKIVSLLGGTVKLTGKTLASLPIIPVPGKK